MNVIPFLNSYVSEGSNPANSNAVVIGHATKANPNINGDSTKNSEQDYRSGTRVVYHNGEVLFTTQKKGRITAAEINKHLKTKLGDEY